MKIIYPNINKLGLKIYSKPYPHVKSKELNAALISNQLDTKLFNKYFGINACLLLEDGQSGLYPIDVEPALERLINGNITGNQRPELWD